MKPLAGGLVALTAALSVYAGGFQVQPVRLDLAAGQGNAVLTISNPSREPLLIQAEAFAWRQDAGGDVLEPTVALLLNPPIFEIAPGNSQLVRVGLRPGRSMATREASYHIWLSQLPGSEPDPAQGVRMLFRVSLPLFVTPSGPAQARADWVLEAGRLTVRNPGTRHLQVRSVRLTRTDGASVSLPMRYALAGAVAGWPLPAGWAGQTLAIEADTDAGILKTRLDPGEGVPR